MPNTAVFAIPIPTQHPCYEAHFPGNPIVPGALLLQWIVRLLKEQYPEIEVQQLRSVKFLAVVKPGDQCELNVDYQAEQQRLQIRLDKQDSAVIKGSFNCQPVPSQPTTEPTPG